MSGKWLIATILGVALIAAVTAWQQQWSRGDAALQFWGSRSAYVIRCGNRVELVNYPNPARGSVANESAPDGDSNLPSSQSPIEKSAIDISHARGLVHARQALIVDASFVWPEAASSDDGRQRAATATKPSARLPEEAFTVAFIDDASGDEVKIRFDFPEGCVRVGDTGKTACLTPGVTQGMYEFLREQIPQ